MPGNNQHDGAEGIVCTSFCQYADPHITQLGDIINARAKLRHGALAHIITARILDSHPSSEQLQNLIDNPQYLDQLFAHIATEVLPGSVPIKTGVVPQATIESPGQALERLPTLPRNRRRFVVRSPAVRTRMNMPKYERAQNTAPLNRRLVADFARNVSLQMY